MIIAQMWMSVMIEEYGTGVMSLVFPLIVTIEIFPRSI
jgi:hypothetical protein